MGIPDIIIVDDHKTFRQGVKFILENQCIATVIGEASDGAECLELLSHAQPDIVLMDISMPGMDGYQATRRALELIPRLKIIVFTMAGNSEYFAKMIGLGVMGFILKTGGFNELETAISNVSMGLPYFSKDITNTTPIQSG